MDAPIRRLRVDRLTQSIVEFLTVGKQRGEIGSADHFPQ